MRAPARPRARAPARTRTRTPALLRPRSQLVARRSHVLLLGDSRMRIMAFALYKMLGGEGLWSPEQLDCCKALVCCACAVRVLSLRVRCVCSGLASRSLVATALRRDSYCAAFRWRCPRRRSAAAVSAGACVRRRTAANRY